jgi:hypothetical protein
MSGVVFLKKLNVSGGFFQDFGLEDVPHAVGGKVQIDVIDVHTQDTRLMTLQNFCQNFRIPLEDRATSEVLNCLSLEVSDSALGDQVQRKNRENEHFFHSISGPA